MNHTDTHTPATDRDDDRRAKRIIWWLETFVLLAVILLCTAILLAPSDQESTTTGAKPADVVTVTPEPVPAPEPVKVSNPYDAAGESVYLTTGTRFVAPIFANDTLPDGDLTVTLDNPGKVANVKGWAVHDESGKYLRTVPANTRTVTRHYRLIVAPTNKQGQESIAYTVCPVGFDTSCADSSFFVGYSTPTY